MQSRNLLTAFVLGTTALFGASAQGQQYQVLHQFLAKPAFPYAGLIQGSDGNFYGTTEQGGAAGVGTVFKITPAGNLTILHSFAGSDGAHPEAGLTQGSDGNFYGATFEQGANTLGTIFKITPSGTFTTLHQFTGLMADGANPVVPPIQASDGTFYGTTALGGAGTVNGFTGGNGTVFKMTPAGVLTTLYSFAVTDGENPLSGLIEGSDGSFYGTTWQGGVGVNPTTNTTGSGTVFKITPSGTLTTLHFFTGRPIDGANPQAGLIRGSDGNFYGVSATGGLNNNGSVFKMDSSGTVTLLHSFGGSTDGSSPLHAPLVQGSDGNFYGTAFSGGPYNSGAVFKMDSLGNLTVLHFFGGNDGSQPYAPIIQGSDGNFYGTTYSGGTNGKGIVFKMDSSGNATELHSFSGSDGANPTNLIQGRDGNFYGATFDGGATNNGTLFKMAKTKWIGSFSLWYRAYPA